MSSSSAKTSALSLTTSSTSRSVRILSDSSITVRARRSLSPVKSCPFPSTNWSARLASSQIGASFEPVTVSRAFSGGSVRTGIPSASFASKASSDASAISSSCSACSIKELTITPMAPNVTTAAAAMGKKRLSLLRDLSSDSLP